MLRPRAARATDSEEKTDCRGIGIGCVGCGYFVWQGDKEAAAPAVGCYGRGGTCHGVCMEVGDALGERDAALYLPHATGGDINGMVFILGILPHDQYGRSGWKARL